MVNKNIAWAKTVLSVQRYLDRICGAIDKLVERRALNSFYVTTANLGVNGVENVANAIIDLIERKVRLINLKVAIDFALEDMNVHYASLLIEKYVDCDKVGDIAKRHDIPVRSLFRKLQNAENDFMNGMACVGFNIDKLESYLTTEKWLIDVYTRYSNEPREEIFDMSERRLAYVLQA